jgi:hypothetical protein
MEAAPIFGIEGILGTEPAQSSQGFSTTLGIATRNSLNSAGAD